MHQVGPITSRGHPFLTSEVPMGCPLRHGVTRFVYLPRWLLADFASQTVAPLEQLESLEQLRALYCGHEIRIADAIEPVPAGVDTQKDLDAVRRLMAP